MNDSVVEPIELDGAGTEPTIVVESESTETNVTEPTEVVGELIEVELPKYVVMNLPLSEVFGFYVLLILATLVVYPIYRVLHKAVGGVSQWK